MDAFFNQIPIVKLVTDSREYRTWVPDENGELDEWGCKKGYYRVHPPTNLCAYVNRLPFIALISTMVSLMVGLVISILVAIPFVDLLMDLWFGQLFFGELTWLAVVELVMATGLGLVYWMHVNKRQIPTIMKTPISKIAPTFDVIKQYVSDRHDKVCRKLTFNDK